VDRDVLLKKCIKRRVMKIRNFKMGLQMRIVHNIVQNNFIDNENFNQQAYLLTFRESLESNHIPKNMIDSILNNIELRVVEEMKFANINGFVDHFGGSQIHPFVFAEQFALCIMDEIYYLKRISYLRKKKIAKKRIVNL